jgi:hypothetical protein
MNPTFALGVTRKDQFDVELGLEQAARLGAAHPAAQLTRSRRRDVVVPFEDRSVLRCQHQPAARTQEPRDPRQEVRLAFHMRQEFETHRCVKAPLRESELHEITSHEADMRHPDPRSCENLVREVGSGYLPIGGEPFAEPAGSASDLQDIKRTIVDCTEPGHTTAA